MELRKCTTCGKEKELTEEHFMRSDVKYFKRRCRVCENKRTKENRKKSPEKWKAYREKTKEARNLKRRKRYSEDEEFRKNQLESTKKWRIKNPGANQGYKTDIPGVYQIKNCITGKVYIGESIHHERRIGQHKSYLRGRIHPNSSLQEDWNKFGEESFKFEVLYFNTEATKEQIYLKETEIIDNVILEGIDLYNLEKTK
tara:strand:+ start:45 stop:641 length:597 start_codon:yes stop_codon:yes gene_type:complete